jgi:hypothetical protein
MITKGIMDEILHQHGLLGDALTGLRQALEGVGIQPVYAQPPNQADILSQVLIRAVATQDPWATLRAKLGTGAIEDPFAFGDHARFGKHIKVLAGQGPQSQNVFRFHIHPQDRDKGRGSRSRNEIKADNGSPSNVKCFENDIVRFHWWFRMAPSYLAVGDNILFQLHSTAINSPIVKLQADGRENPSKLEVTHDPDNRGPERPLGAVDFSPLRGQWLECECIARFSNSGYLRFSVWNPSGDRVISFERSPDMWSGNITRPKWGIYRGREQGYRSEDSVDFAAITIQKLRELP